MRSDEAGRRDPDDLDVPLTPDEALVLHDVLQRWDRDGTGPTDLRRGEAPAFWALTQVLERLLVEPFAENYDELVRAARHRLWEQSGA